MALLADVAECSLWLRPVTLCWMCTFFPNLSQPLRILKHHLCCVWLFYVALSVRLRSGFCMSVCLFSSSILLPVHEACNSLAYYIFTSLTARPPLLQPLSWATFPQISSNSDNKMETLCLYILFLQIVLIRQTNLMPFPPVHTSSLLSFLLFLSVQSQLDHDKS